MPSLIISEPSLSPLCWQCGKKETDTDKFVPCHATSMGCVWTHLHASCCKDRHEQICYFVRKMQESDASF